MTVPGIGRRNSLFGKKLGKQALAEVASIVTPETVLAWHWKLVAQKFDSSKDTTGAAPPPPLALTVGQLAVRVICV